MSETRPNGGELDDAAQMLASARARLSAAVAEAGLPESLRLSERERTTIANLRDRLLREVEDELRSGIAARLDMPEQASARAAVTSAILPIAHPILERSQALARPELVALLLRRAEEHRLSRFTPERPLLIDLAGDSDPRIAGEATALLIAQSRRLDAFQEPVLMLADVAAEVEHGLVWSVAAALRSYLVAHHQISPDLADEAVTAAASAVLARHDEGAGIDAASRRLAGRLAAEGRLDGDLLVRAAREGAFPLFLAGLGQLTGFELAALSEIFLDRDGAGVPLVLRIADLHRAPAAEILLLLASREDAVGPQLDAFDALTAQEAATRLRLWRFDPAYRAAIARLSR